ncbi:MAG: hypothetical protein J0H49_34055 [Acidobacteria bacterium]|nr:hypothetical protein [Acidobacteriota bacterium]
MIAGVSLWSLLVVAGLAKLAEHQVVAGQAGHGSASWPAAAGFAHDSRRPTLVMLAHPGCPCTLASLRELEKIQGETSVGVTAHILFLEIPGAADEDSATIRLARSLPGVVVHVGMPPETARIWGARTSGQVFLYSVDGRLLFSGGITFSRGHEGLNLGHSAIVAFLRTGKLSTNHAPVFGCSLLGAA